MKFADICFPKRNEEEFIDVARRLGTGALVMVYQSVPSGFDSLKKKSEKQGIEVFQGSMIPAKGSELVISSHPKDPLKVIRNGNIDVMSGMEFDRRQDFVHHRSSGLNQVVCSSAKEKDIMVGLDLGMLSAHNEQGKALGRMAQNIGLCRKFKVSMMAASFAQTPMELRSEQDIKALLHVLGMDKEMAEQTLGNSYKRASDNRERNEGKLIKKGIREL